MSANNPQVENDLQALAEICLEALKGEGTEANERVEPLLKSLLMSGYARTAETSLQADLEARVKNDLDERPVRHSEALVGIAGNIQKKFEELKRWESKQPEPNPPAKAASFSAATKS